MIVCNEEKSLPVFWTDEACYELVFHALQLDNPLSRELMVFVQDRDGESQFWDYSGMRLWIYLHLAEVEYVWKLEVRDAF